jgi:hypothetical protein
MKRLLKLPKLYWLVIAIALITSFINAKVGFDGFLQTAIPWGVIAFTIAFFAPGKQASLKLSGIFGFIVSYAFLWFDNRGIKSFVQIWVLIPLNILPALFGLLCGALCGYLGWSAKKIFYIRSNRG